MRDERTRRRENNSSNSAPSSRQSDRRRKRQEQRKRRQQSIKLLVIIIAAVVLAIVLLFAFLNSSDKKSKADDANIEQQVAYNKINFDVSGDSDASVEPAFIEVAENEECERLPYAKKDDSRFTGWLYTPEGGGEAIHIDNSNRSTLPKGMDITLTPMFEEKPTKVDENTRGLPVLMYHYFYDPETEDNPGDNNFFEIDSFEEQMKYLHDNNYYYPTWDEVIEFIYGNILLPEKSVVITADDGHESVFRLALPVLEKYNVTATSFIVGIDASKEFLNDNSSEYITFESHTYDMHKWSEKANGGWILSASAEEIKEDVENSSNLLGTKRVYCYPYGHIDEDAKKALKENGVQLGFTVEFGRDYPMMDPLELPRIRMSGGEPLDYFITRVE